MAAPAQYSIGGRSAAEIVRSVEHGVTAGTLRPGDTVPSVRSLARTLSVSPTTVASAYRDLRQRGVLVARDRSRTVVAQRPPLATRPAAELAAGVVDLASGNPDPALLPDLAPALTRIDPGHRLYGGPPGLPPLLERARASFAADGIAAEQLAVVAGGLDGIERVLAASLRPGDAIAVEDPGYDGSLDLVRALGLRPVPVPVDDEGPVPDRLAVVLAAGVAAVLVVPRAQNPYGAAVTPSRARDLVTVLARHPDVLVVEDDHAGPVAAAPATTLTAGRARWAVVRSLAKSLGPDLRLAVLTGDADVVTRVLGRQQLGTGWVSHLLQRLAVEVWDAARYGGALERAAAAYAARRRALIDALATAGVEAHGASGLNVWVRVPAEVPVVQGLLARGWAVQAGERYRIEAAAAIRVTVATLPPERAAHLAADLVEVADRRVTTRQG